MMKRNTWRGVPGTRFFYLNGWSDPEIMYQGKTYDAVEVEDTLYDFAREDIGVDDIDDDQFNDWLTEHQNDVYEVLNAIDPIGTAYDSANFNDTVVKRNGYGDPYIIAS